MTNECLRSIRFAESRNAKAKPALIASRNQKENLINTCLVAGLSLCRLSREGGNSFLRSFCHIEIRTPNGANRGWAIAATQPQPKNEKSRQPMSPAFKNNPNSIPHHRDLTNYPTFSSFITNFFAHCVVMGFGHSLNFPLQKHRHLTVPIPPFDYCMWLSIR